MRIGRPPIPESPFATVDATPAFTGVLAPVPRRRLEMARSVLSSHGPDVLRAVLAGGVLWVAIGLWIALIPLVRPQVSADAPPGPPLDDFGVFYSAARMVRDGRGDELYDLHALEGYERQVYERPHPVLPYFNPPPFAAALVPLTLLPVGAAAAAFLIATAALCGGALVALMRRSHVSYSAGMLACVMVLGFHPLHDIFFHGQVSFLVTFAFALLYLAVASRNERLAGAALSILLVKPNFLILPLALLLWKRRTRALTAFAIIAACWTIASVLIAGPAVLRDYPAFLREAAGWDDTNGIAITGMFGWNAFVRWQVGPGEVGLVNAWTLALSVPTAMLALASWRGPWTVAPRDLALRFSALVIASMLINPHLYRQDMLLAAVPALLVMSAVEGRSRAIAGAALFAGWLLFLYHFTLLRHLDVNTTVVALAAMLVTTSGLSLLRTRPQPADEPDRAIPAIAESATA